MLYLHSHSSIIYCSQAERYNYIRARYLSSILPAFPKHFRTIISLLLSHHCGDYKVLCVYFSNISLVWGPVLCDCQPAHTHGWLAVPFQGPGFQILHHSPSTKFSGPVIRHLLFPETSRFFPRLVRLFMLHPPSQTTSVLHLLSVFQEILFILEGVAQLSPLLQKLPDFPSLVNVNRVSAA